MIYEDLWRQQGRKTGGEPNTMKTIEKQEQTVRGSRERDHDMVFLVMLGTPIGYSSKAIPGDLGIVSRERGKKGGKDLD